jgi:hypothetical protein
LFTIELSSSRQNQGNGTEAAIYRMSTISRKSSWLGALTPNQGALNNTFSSKAHRLSTVRFVNVLQLNETSIVLAVVLVLHFAGGLYFFTLPLN